MENRGIDVSMTFSMHLALAAGPFSFQSLDAPGRLGRVDTRGAEAKSTSANYLFKTSSILYGTIADVKGTQEPASVGAGGGWCPPEEGGAPDMDIAGPKTGSLARFLRSCVTREPAAQSWGELTTTTLKAEEPTSR